MTTHYLYWDKQWATMFAAYHRDTAHTNAFDGADTFSSQVLQLAYLYGSIEITLIPPSHDLSLLPHAKISCLIRPIHSPENRAFADLDTDQLLILDQTDEPLTQALCYLNRHKHTAQYQMSVERRTIINSSRYGNDSELVSLAGSWPGEIQWCYHGTTWSYERWETWEQAKLENMLHGYITNQQKVYWVFEKRQEHMVEFRYYAKRHTWQTGVGTNTLEDLAILVKKYVKTR